MLLIQRLEATGRAEKLKLKNSEDRLLGCCTIFLGIEGENHGGNKRKIDVIDAGGCLTIGSTTSDGCSSIDWSDAGLAFVTTWVTALVSWLGLTADWVSKVNGATNGFIGPKKTDAEYVPQHATDVVWTTDLPEIGNSGTSTSGSSG